MPLMQRMLRHRVFSTGDAMRDQDIVSETMGHLYAALLVLYSRLVSVC